MNQYVVLSEHHSHSLTWTDTGQSTEELWSQSVCCALCIFCVVRCTLYGHCNIIIHAPFVLFCLLTQSVLVSIRPTYNRDALSKEAVAAKLAPSTDGRCGLCTNEHATNTVCVCMCGPIGSMSYHIPMLLVNTRTIKWLRVNGWIIFLHKPMALRIIFIIHHKCGHRNYHRSWA